MAQLLADPDRCSRAACNAFLSRLLRGLGVGDPDAETDEEATAVQGSCSCSWCFCRELELYESSDEQTDRRLEGVVQTVESEHERDDTGEDAVGVVGDEDESRSRWCKQNSGNCSALPLLGCRCSGDNDPAASGILVEGPLAAPVSAVSSRIDDEENT